MLRGLPCQSAGLATSGSDSTAASACGSHACGSWSGSAINSQTASLAKSTRKERCHALIKTMQRTMQGTHDAKRQLKENTTWQRLARDFIYQQANRTITYLRASHSDPKSRTERNKQKFEQLFQGYKYGRKEFIQHQQKKNCGQELNTCKT